MWDFLAEVMKQHGFLAVLQVVQAAAIVYLFRGNQVRQKEIVELHEKRLADAKEGKDNYEALARNLDKSVDLLIKVFRQRVKLNGDD